MSAGLQVSDGVQPQAIAGGNITVGSKVFGRGSTAGGTASGATPASTGGSASAVPATTVPEVSTSAAVAQSLSQSPALIFGAVVVAGLVLVLAFRRK